MLAHEAAAQAAIHALYAEPILYTGGAFDAEPLTAIWSDMAAPAFQGAGATLRELRFEIFQSALPFEPDKSHRVERVNTGEVWAPNDITRRDDIGAWVIVVEDPEE